MKRVIKTAVAFTAVVVCFALFGHIADNAGEIAYFISEPMYRVIGGK